MSVLRRRSRALLVALLIGGAALAGCSTAAAVKPAAVKAAAPASSSFSAAFPAGEFPIAVWDQSPNGGDVPAPYTNQAQAFKAMGVNIFLGLYGWPENATSDDGEYAAAVANGMYVIAGSPGTAVNDTIATNPSYFLGYQLGDEPACTINVPAAVAAANAADPNHLTFDNQNGVWIADLPSNDLGSASCLTEEEANLVAPSILSADDYALTDPWHDGICESGNPSGDLDCLYMYGEETKNALALDTSGKPFWAFVETGTDDLGLSEQNGGIGEYKDAPPAGVNSAAWDAIINGATGIEWFCDDTVAYDACAGGGSDGNPSGGSTVIPANLTYIDNTVQGFAPELLSPNVAGFSGTSSNTAVPVETMTKSVGGNTYLFAMSNRNGSTTATFTDAGLAGKTATVVYDSAERYDTANAEQGKTFTLSSSGAFTDTLGTSANPYQVKVYELGAAVTPPTNPPTTTTPPAPPTTTPPAPPTTVPPVVTGQTQVQADINADIAERATLNTESVLVADSKASTSIKDSVHTALATLAGEITAAQKAAQAWLTAN